MQAYVGQISLFGFNFPPVGWLLCNGQVLSISQYEALFNLIGTTYGGDGIQTFAVPDLQGRAAIGVGQGPVTNYNPGDKSGFESITLTTAQLPAHSHLVQCTPDPANSSTASANIPATGPKDYAPGPATTPMTDTVSMAGGGLPHENRQPYLAMNWCICVDGLYPSPN